MISRDFGSDIVELPWVRPGQSPQRRGLVFFMVFQKSGMPFVSISSLLLLAFVWLFMPSLCLPENPCQVSSVLGEERESDDINGLKYGVKGNWAVSSFFPRCIAFSSGSSNEMYSRLPKLETPDSRGPNLTIRSCSAQ